MTGNSRASTGHMDVAYRDAVAHLVYPALDEAAPWFKPIMLRFDVDRDQVLGLAAFLDERWKSNHPPSFYFLEQSRRNYPWAFELGRSELIYACRYLFLHDLFDEKFWNTLCERGNSPFEAELIVLPRPVEC